MEHADILIRIWYEPTRQKYAEAFFFELTAALIRNDFRRDKYEISYKNGAIMGWMKNDKTNQTIEIIALPLTAIFNPQIITDINICFVDSALIYEGFTSIIKELNRFNKVTLYYDDKGIILPDGI